jgi:UDP-4-amino-4,6-dideoxy-N-acetyl-beta-L-altrosamine transaminase
MLNKSFPYGKQEISSDDIDEVVKVLKSDFLTQGPNIEKFENQFAQYVGSKFAVAVSNGTTALHLSVLALNLKPGEKVITTPLSFVATANCVKYCGADIDFVDIDSETYLMDLEKLRELLSNHPKGTYKGIIAVDFSGRAVNLELLKNIAKEYDLWIIEDACHSPGGYFVDSKNNKQYCGNGNFAELSVFSFHPVKHIACGEGGMITTNSIELYNKLLKFRTHGITKNPSYFVNDIIEVGGKENYPGWYMEMQDLGYNYRLTDMQAALGISQLKRANNGVERRREIAKKYWDCLSNMKSILGQSGSIEGHAYHLYIIEVNNRLEVYNYLRDNHIYTQVHYFPIHLMPYYKNYGWGVGDFPNVEKYYKRCLSLPIYPSLQLDDLNFILEKVETIKNI